MTLPLYQNTAAPNAMPGGAHPGLWFERFFSAWNADYREIDKHERSAWLHQFRTAGESAALNRHTTRIMELAQSRQGATRIYLCSGNFISGIGNAHPLENGFTWHPTLGVPYLPGSTVKGLVRAAVETAYAGENKAEILKRWFGSEDKNPEHVSENAGQFTFLDALPTQPCKLHAEVMTPHMGKWYEQGRNDPSEPDTMPGDWHSPVPLPYLVARNLQLLFAILPRTSAAANEIDSVWDALDYALWHLGAGAKTAIGFGIMQTEGANAEPWEGAWLKLQGNGTLVAQKGEHTAYAYKSDPLLTELNDAMRGKLKRGTRCTASVARQGKDIRLLSFTIRS